MSKIAKHIAKMKFVFLVLMPKSKQASLQNKLQQKDMAMPLQMSLDPSPDPGEWQHWVDFNFA